MKEQRTMRVMINKSGGNSGKDTLNYRVSIPNVWANALKLTKESRDLLMTFDGKKITIQRPKEE